MADCGSGPRGPALQRSQYFEEGHAERVEAPRAASVRREQDQREREKERGAEEDLISPQELEHDGLRIYGVRSCRNGRVAARPDPEDPAPNLLDRHVL